MNKLLLSVLAVFVFAFSASAQDMDQSKRELGIRLTSLNDFGMIYKRQVDENKYIRYRIAIFDTEASFSGDMTDLDIFLAASIGFEKRKDINENFDFIFGPELIFNAGLLDLGMDDSQTSLGLQVGYVLGVLWHLSDHFYMGLETIPGIGLNYHIRPEADNALNLNLGFNATAVALKAVYKFSKE